MKKLLDALQAAGVQIMDSEYILSVIGGLESDFDFIVAMISAQVSSISLPEVCHLLLSQEACNNHNVVVNPVIPTANAVFRRDKDRPTCQIC